MDQRWDVLSEVWVSMFISDRRCLSATSYLVKRLDVPAVAIGITTTSAFPHLQSLHHGWMAVARLWCGFQGDE